MDEPLSNLDAKLRVRVRADLARLHAQLGVTTVYVTHDQVEAMTLGQRAAVMNAGKIQQVDTPQALYWSPMNLFVAAFIGSPSMNLVEVHVDDGCLRFAGFSLPLAALGRDPNFLDASKAQGKIDAVMNNPKHVYWSGNKQAVFEMSLLFALVAQQR